MGTEKLVTLDNDQLRSVVAAILLSGKTDLISLIEGDRDLAVFIALKTANRIINESEEYT